MLNLNIETIFIVGAGFSHYAGLPLTNRFTDAILEARRFESGPSRLLVEFLSLFIHDTFDHSTRARAKYWPDLEDIFTCVDLSANSGHHLGSTFAPADLRTTRRALLSRIIRMLDHKYKSGRKKKGPSWLSLDDFFLRAAGRNVAFISMNWDTVVERKLAVTLDDFVLDYCCDASAARIPDPPDEQDFPSRKAYDSELQKGQVITIEPVPRERRKSDLSTPLIKIHGSANWLYCDNCRQLFWFHPDQSRRIADQLIGVDDLTRIRTFLSKRKPNIGEAFNGLGLPPKVKCLCSHRVPLGTRIATFSYRKALEFPMFQKSWFAAEELLRSASKWVFIGYSLPAADYEFKYLLKRTQLSRHKQPKFIVVSGGKRPDVRRAYRNYHRFFGRVIDKSSFFTAGLTQDALAAIFN